jgi:hypothetical protein
MTDYLYMTYDVICLLATIGGCLPPSSLRHIRERETINYMIDGWRAARDGKESIYADIQSTHNTQCLCLVVHRSFIDILVWLHRFDVIYNIILIQSNPILS